MQRTAAGVEIQRVVGSDEPGGAGRRDGAGHRLFQSGREPQQAPFTGAVLADHANDHAVGRGGVEVVRAAERTRDGMPGP